MHSGQNASNHCIQAPFKPGEKNCDTFAVGRSHPSMHFSAALWWQGGEKQKKIPFWVPYGIVPKVRSTEYYERAAHYARGQSEWFEVSNIMDNLHYRNGESERFDFFFLSSSEVEYYLAVANLK